MSSISRRISWFLALVTSAGAPHTAWAQAQQQTQAGAVTLSLADAIRLGERESEAMRVALAGTGRARGQHMQARSQLFPDVAGSLSYQRAIQSQFEEIGKRLGGGDDSASNGDGGGDLADSPLARIFASPNTFILGVTASQTIYAGGRVRAGIAAADAGRRAADLGTRTARAQLIYAVAEAYFNAQVASQLHVIAESSFVQAERAYAQTELAREVGNVAEYDLIRARVQRDNARPAVIAARTQRDVALIHLRQMLNLPPDQTLSLTTPVEEARQAPVGSFRTVMGLPAATADTTVASRAFVRQAAENVIAQENQVAMARAQRRPSLALSMNYQRFAYPAEGSVFEESWKYYFPNWNVSLGLSMPLFTGGRQRGQELVAQANLDEARARLDEAREAAAFDTRLIVAQLEQAEAAYAASIGTDEQAARAYTISEVRFAEGIGTQLELTQARVDLETARANRVRAARDVALARLGAALLQDLPFGVATGDGGR